MRANGRMISLADKIRRQLKAGKTPKEIARMLGTSASLDFHGT
jgi:DNA-binding CsgD family transcriptional regulator